MMTFLRISDQLLCNNNYHQILFLIIFVCIHLDHHKWPLDLNRHHFCHSNHSLCPLPYPLGQTITFELVEYFLFKENWVCWRGSHSLFKEGWGLWRRMWYLNASRTSPESVCDSIDSFLTDSGGLVDLLAGGVDHVIAGGVRTDTAWTSKIDSSRLSVAVVNCNSVGTMGGMDGFMTDWPSR